MTYVRQFTKRRIKRGEIFSQEFILAYKNISKTSLIYHYYALIDNKEGKTRFEKLSQSNEEEKYLTLLTRKQSFLRFLI